MYKEITEVEELQDYMKNSNNLYAVIDFYASWCKPCKKIAPYFENLSNLDTYEDLEFLKINVDEANEIADKFQVSRLPTFLVISTKNMEVEERLEEAEEEKIKKLCDKYI